LINTFAVADIIPVAGVDNDNNDSNSSSNKTDVNDHDDETVGTNTDEVLIAEMDAKYGPRT
jgi:hypothetical protein